MKNPPKSYIRERSSIFGLFLLISLLLHLLAGLLLQNRQIFPELQQRTKQIPVALQERKNWLELDQKPFIKAAKPPLNATHIAEANQKVAKETAPKGDESRDQQAVKTQRAQPALKETSSAIHRRQRPKQRAVVRQAPFPALQSNNRAKQKPASELVAKQAPIPLKLPKLTDLTRLSPNTLARLERKQRVKNRPEIDLKGDEVWLDLRQNDKLISFFRRFSDRIEAVWNYPIEASSRGVEGTLLVKIVVNKKGELIDALPIKGSGSDILDYEAITAIYRAAPFGPLPSYFKYNQLKIYAHFQYNLSHRMIYGRP